MSEKCLKRIFQCKLENLSREELFKLQEKIEQKYLLINGEFGTISYKDYAVLITCINGKKVASLREQQPDSLYYHDNIQHYNISQNLTCEYKKILPFLYICCT